MASRAGGPGGRYAEHARPRQEGDDRLGEHHDRQRRGEEEGRGLPQSLSACYRAAAK